MSMTELALQNFKSSFKNYLAVILSMAFTILVLFNFQNIIYSGIFDGMGGENARNIDIIIQVISVVLGCFMFFFLWYSTNVFLTNRKKEIGIYVFMGLTNQKIGMLYLIETILTGLFSLVLGIGFGVVSTHLFQMILLSISDIAVEIPFHISIRPIVYTSGIYLCMYLIFAVKGYVNIVRSSVLEMVSASRKNEYVRQNRILLYLKTVLGTCILSAGYFLAVKEGGQEVMNNVLLAVVLVIIGVYLLFAGFFPLMFQKLAQRKAFLYKKERTLWINSVIFRMKKNYRTYAMTCVLMICSVTALATSFAMKYRYDSMVHFRNVYTYQFLSSKADLDSAVRSIIEQENDIAYAAELPVLMLQESEWDAGDFYDSHVVVSYSQIKKLAEKTGLECSFQQPKEDEIIKISHLYLLSLLTDESNVFRTVHGKSYRQVLNTSEPYLGYLQEMMSFYLVNDAEYERLLPFGEEMYTYHYRIKDIYNFAASTEALDTLRETADPNLGRVTIDPNNSDMEWIKVLFTIGLFMFMVFILASGSILFMKLYNDAFEEKERMLVLKKIGIAGKTLKKSISHELKTAYAIPFLVMTVSAYFSVHALEKMMSANLMAIYFVSVAAVFAVFFLFYHLSVFAFTKNADIS